jgi:hypothetical protein
MKRLSVPIQYFTMYFLASRHTLKAFLKLSIRPADAWAAAWPASSLADGEIVG